MRKFLSKFDIFPAVPTLRAEGEAQVVNLCGSIFSILMFVGFIFIFATNVSSLINFQQISATQILTMDRPSDKPIGNITISIGIFNASILQLRSIFELHAYTTDRTLVPRPIQVFPCQRQMWSMFDDVKYHTLNIEHNMCIQKEGVEIFGQFGAPQASFIVLNLTICNNATSPVTCAPPAMINGFFATRMLWNRFIPISVVLLDTGISATNKNPLTYIPYEKTLFLLVNLKQQTFVQTFIGTYQIQTDVSFLPIVQQELMTGYFVNECIVTTIVNYLNLPIFLEFYIFPSPINRAITRSYGKLDGVLSYFGGLYGIVTSFFAFFMLSFNQYKYELRVGQGAFAYKEAHLAKSSDLNFLKYLKYVMFDWIKTLFCVTVNWKDCKAIDEARQEAIQQIDVRHLLKRISHLEKVISAFVTKDNEKVMYMAQSNSLQEVRNRRSIVEYCHKFNVADNCPTIGTFENIETVVNYSLGPLVRTQSSLIAPEPSTQKNDREMIFLTDDSKSKEFNDIFLNRNQEKTSLVLMDEYVQKYIEKFDINQSTFQISEEQLETEKQLAQAFYGIDEATRLSIIRKIPLGILYRMWKQNSYKTDNNENIMEIPLTLTLQNGETRQLRRRKKRKHIGSDVSNLDKTLQLKQQQFNQ